jgi:estrone sulfotransferase
MKSWIARHAVARRIYRNWWEKKYGVSKQDIFLVSYPRSGNTWVRFMLLQARPGFKVEDFRRIEEIIPDMHGPLPWFRCRRANVVKSHLTYWQPFRRVIYLVRDGRAATYSNWQYQVAEGTYHGDFDKFLDTPHWPSAWNSHVKGWENAPVTKLVVRYENLVADTAYELSRILEAVGWSTSRERIVEIVANSSKEKMRAWEKEKEVRLHRVGDAAAAGWREAFDARRNACFAAGLDASVAKYLQK